LYMRECLFTGLVYAADYVPPSDRYRNWHGEVVVKGHVVVVVFLPVVRVVLAEREHRVAPD